MSKKILLIGGIIVVAGALVGPTVWVNTPSHKGFQVSDNSLNSEEWAKYQDPTCQIEFTYPKHWSLTVSGKGARYIIQPSRIFETACFKIPFEEAVNEVRQNLKDRGLAYSEQQTLLSQSRAQVIKYCVPHFCGKSSYVTVVEHGDHTFKISLDAAAISKGSLKFALSDEQAAREYDFLKKSARSSYDTLWDRIFLSIKLSDTQEAVGSD